MADTPVHWFLRWFAGGFYRLCEHQSHRLRLPCFRGFVMDARCGKHLESCYQGCPPATTTEETNR